MSVRPWRLDEQWMLNLDDPWRFVGTYTNEKRAREAVRRYCSNVYPWRARLVNRDTAEVIHLD